LEITIEHIATALMALIGAALVYCGFNCQHKYRLIKDIPRSKVRSIALGLVEVHGRVEADELLAAPFSGSRCVYHKYEIKEYRRHTRRDSKGRTSTSYRWETIARGERRIPFFARDDTGRVRVEPTGAEIDISLKKAFLQRAGAFGGLGRFITALKNWDSLKETAMDVSGMKLEPLEAGSGLSLGSRVGDRKYLEYYLEPEENLFVIGTAANRRDAPDRVQLGRGENEPTFIISNKKEQALLKALKKKMLSAFIIGVIFLVGGVILFLYVSNVFR